MRVYISRHGEASFDAESDFSRPLTERGISQTRELVQANINRFSAIQHIWVSPLLRAQQTALVYQDALSITPQTKPFITPESSPSQVIRQLEKAGLSDLLLVSHQPLVGDLVSLLVEGNTYQPHPYTTSEVLVLEAEMYVPGMASVVARFCPGV